MPPNFHYIIFSCLYIHTYNWGEKNILSILKNDLYNSYIIKAC